MLDFKAYKIKLFTPIHFLKTPIRYRKRKEPKTYISICSFRRKHEKDDKVQHLKNKYHRLPSFQFLKHINTLLIINYLTKRIM